MRKFIMLTKVTANLLLRDDDLATCSIVGIRNWVVEDADCADHLAHLLHF